MVHLPPLKLETYSSPAFTASWQSSIFPPANSILALRNLTAELASIAVSANR